MEKRVRSVEDKRGRQQKWKEEKRALEGHGGEEKRGMERCVESTERTDAAVKCMCY